MRAAKTIHGGYDITARPTLPARLHPVVRQLIHEHSELVRELVCGLGSPLHLLLPQVFAETAREFVRTLADAKVSGQVLYAMKANKGRCYLQQCAALGLGVDVASAPELEHALCAGVNPERIGISGPTKARELIDLGVRQGACIAIDAREELELVDARARALGRTARVLLRCRPESQGQGHSRFGLTAAEREDALRLCVKQRERIRLEGFSFHLSGYDAASRARMADRMIDLCLAARARGLDCNTVDIGGGFAVRYTEPEHWQSFTAAATASDYHAGKTFGEFYPYASESAGPAMLAEILAMKLDGSSTLCARFEQHQIRLVLEPGRALLDQSGVSAFRVQGVKDRHASESYALLTVEGTSFSLSEQWFNSEYLPDPLLLADDPVELGRDFYACVGGASCLECDMVTWRKIGFRRRVKVGDILIYANTAGYQMDSNESPFHLLPLPRKVVIGIEDHAVRWRLDEVFERQTHEG